MIGPRLKDLGRWFSGGTPPSERVEYWDGDVPWLSGKDFDRTVLREPTKFTTEEGAALHSRLMPGGRSVLLLVRGMALAHGLPVARLPFDAAINQDVRGLVVRPAFDPVFVYYALIGRRAELDAHIDRAAHGTARLLDTVYSHRIAWMPELAAQRMIADSLDRECERIDLAVRLGRVLRDRTSERVSEVRRAVLGMRTLEAELADATRGVERPRLKHAVNRWFSGATPTSTEPIFWTEPPDGVPWVAIGDMSQRAMVQDTARALTSPGLQETRQVVAPAGTVLVAMYASVGEVAELARPAAFNQALLGLWIEDPHDRAFVVQWIHALRPLLGLFVRSNTQDNLSAEVVRDLPFVVMGLEERTAAMAAISEARREMDRVGAHVGAIQTRLTAYRDSLIHEAVTGKLDVTKASDRQMDERLHAAAENRLDEVPV